MFLIQLLFSQLQVMENLMTADFEWGLHSQTAPLWSTSADVEQFVDGSATRPAGTGVVQVRFQVDHTTWCFTEW